MTDTRTLTERELDYLDDYMEDVRNRELAAMLFARRLAVAEWVQPVTLSEGHWLTKGAAAGIAVVLVMLVANWVSL